MRRLKLQSLVLSLLLLGSMLTASVAYAISFSGPYEAQNWQMSGPGSVSKSPSSGTTNTLAFSYALNGTSVWSTQTWQFSTVAAATGPTTLNWNWSGYHAYFQVIAQLDLFADGPSGRQTISLINAGPVNCCSAPSGGFNYSGSNTIQINQGYAFGFIARGRNFDSDSRLLGTLTLSNFNAPGGDTTAPIIASNVSGTLGQNGWYTSDVTVSWTVTDPESPVTSSTGCGSTTITTDTAGTTYTCTATSAGGTASASVNIKRDATAPTISGSRTPGANANGWNNTDVTVSFSCGDSPSGIASCSGPSTVSAEGANQSVTGAAVDQAGNTASATVGNINIDKTPPSITGSRTPGANANGWNNTDVTVSFSCGDGLAGVDACSSPTTLTAEGANQSVVGTVIDKAGNTASATVGNISIDKTLPTVIYSGNAGSYTVDQVIAIVCSAADSLSGVASTTCANINGPAYSFSLGSNSFSASATDKAGNVGNGTTSFTVQVTYSSLCSLTKQFVTQQGIANSLCAKLSAAEAAAARGNANAKAGQLNAYKNEVAAQTGKALTPTQAAILTQLAGALLAQP